MIEIGDIYTARIYYSDDLNQNESKVRPVFIFNIDVESDTYTIAEITTQQPRGGYYCQFKELIVNWQHYGLRKKSYVKCKNIRNFRRNDLISFIGYVEDDLINILTKIYECNS